MPLNHLQTFSRAIRQRPPGPSCRGGASSVLRLTQPAGSLALRPSNLSDWLDRVNRATDSVLPVTGPHFVVGPR